MTCWPVATGGSSGRGVFAAAIVQNIVQIRLKVVFFIGVVMNEWVIRCAGVLRRVVTACLLRSRLQQI